MEQGLQVARAGGDDSDVARAVSEAIVERRLVELEYYKENEDELVRAHGRAVRADERPRGLVRRLVRPRRATACATSAWTASSSATVTDETFEPRPEVDPAAEVDGWLRTGEVQASRSARVWVSPERARWAREARRVVEERGDGAVVVELSFAGVDWLVREILKEAGDAAVLEPAGRARGRARGRRAPERAGASRPPRRRRTAAASCSRPDSRLRR